jgi:putative SbcD/Mre11-related phosphoesterase
MNPKKTKSNFRLIGKTIFFPKQGILAIGDLHLGYTEMLRKQGIMVEIDQLEDTKKEIEPIIKNIKATSKLKKIILLGDIKHHFQFDRGEFFEVWNFLRFLEKHVERENIIIIKGNHDTYKIKNYELKDFYVEEGIAFTHGDRKFKELFEKEINTIVIGHIHPAVLLKDPQGIKKEKFKCFLIGKYKRKDFVVVPSFFSFTEGINFDDVGGRNLPGQMISRQKLKSFDTYIIGKHKIYGFGKLKDLI